MICAEAFSVGITFRFRSTVLSCCMERRANFKRNDFIPLFFCEEISKKPNSAGLPRIRQACLISYLFCNIPSHVDAAGGGVGQGVGDAAAVTDDVQAGIAGLQLVIHFHFHIVELDFHTVE